MGPFLPSRLWSRENESWWWKSAPKSGATSTPNRWRGSPSTNTAPTFSTPTTRKSGTISPVSPGSTGLSTARWPITKGSSIRCPLTCILFIRCGGLSVPNRPRPSWRFSAGRSPASPATWKNRPLPWWAGTSTKSWSRATPKSSGAAPAGSCRPLSSGVCRSG